MKGTIDGLASNTAFYWSTDNVFDLTDQNVQLINDAIIANGDSGPPHDSRHPDNKITQHFLLLKN